MQNLKNLKMKDITYITYVIGSTTVRLHKSSDFGCEFLPHSAKRIAKN